MTKITARAALLALAAGLLTATAASAGSNAFDRKMSSVIAQVKADPGYRPLPLDDDASRVWFADESEALWKKKITREQFLADGAKRFPGYDASFARLADLLAS